MCGSDAAQRHPERDHRSNVDAIGGTGRDAHLEAALFIWKMEVGADMPDLLLEIRISRGEPWRSIATGIWPAGGSLLLSESTEPLPPRLIASLHHHQDEFGPTIGIWNYTVGDANYQVVFSRYVSNVIN